MPRTPTPSITNLDHPSSQARRLYARAAKVAARKANHLVRRAARQAVLHERNKKMMVMLMVSGLLGGVKQNMVLELPYGFRSAA
jgi:hypothetical protein